jgi:peroxiredoxin
LPGAFTTVCSEKQLPGFEENYDKLLGLGINEIYFNSVNDGFVMNAWADQQKLRKVKVLPDGNADFTRSMGMLVDKRHVGFGLRSWRYSAIINDGVVEKWWQEDGMNNDGSDPDPYEQTTPENCVKYLSNQ